MGKHYQKRRIRFDDSQTVPLIRQRIWPHLDMLNGAKPGFREFGHVRTVRLSNPAAFPAGLGLSIRPYHGYSRASDEGMRTTENISFFGSNTVANRSCSSDDHSYPCQAERIRLIYPQKIRIFRTAGFLAVPGIWLPGGSRYVNFPVFGSTRPGDRSPTENHTVPSVLKSIVGAIWGTG